VKTQNVLTRSLTFLSNISHHAIIKDYLGKHMFDPLFSIAADTGFNTSTVFALKGINPFLFF